jgi:hypothetical protein
VNFFRKIFKDKELADAVESFDDLIDSIPPRVELPNKADQTGRLIGDLLNSEDGKKSSDTIERLFQSVAVNQSRLARYKVYDEIIKTVPIIKSVLRVYKTNMINKSPNDDKCFTYLENNELDAKDSNKDKIAIARKIQQKIIKDNNITAKTKNHIIPQVLRYGDSFVEVVDLDEEPTNFAAINQHQSNFLLTESKLNNITDPNILDTLLEQFTEHYLIEKDNSDIDNNSEYVDNLVIKYHNPHNIIVLETRYGTTLGYLEVFNNNIDHKFTTSSAFGATIGKVSSLANQSNLSTEDLTNRLVFHILKKVIKDNTSKIDKSTLALGKKQNSVDDIIKQLDPNIHSFIKKLFIEQGLTFNRSKFRKSTVRFISVDSMVHFSNVSDDYRPYGESIIDHLVIPGKLFMLSQLSNSVNKMSRAALIRFWTLDVGAFQNHTRFGQQFKREMYNSKTTLDDLSSTKTISKFLTD